LLDRPTLKKNLSDGWFHAVMDHGNVPWSDDPHAVENALQATFIVK
jgi:hypothetical protein